MKDTKGITLIALIITIIVMLILVVVTVTTAINGGLFTASQEAKFKTEVSQIKEFVETQKVVEIADNNGVVPDSFNTENLKQAIPDKLLEKYIDTKLEILFDGNLYYIASNLTEKEIQWCEEIGISGTPGIEAFMNNRAEVHFDSSYKWTDDSTITGIVDLEAVRLELKARYPDAVFSYIYVPAEKSKPVVYALSSEEYRNMKNMLESQESNDVERSLLLGATALNIFYNNEHIYLAANPDLNTTISELYNGIEIEMMTKAEAEQMLTFEEATYNTTETIENICSGTYLKVTGYKTANPVVPGYVITSDNELEGVEEIASEAFAATKPLKTDVITLLPIEQILEKDYSAITLGEIKSLMDTVLPDESEAQTEEEKEKIRQEKAKIETIKGRYTENTKKNKDKLFMEFLGYEYNISAYTYDMENMQTEYFDKYFICDKDDGRIYALLEFNQDGNPTFNTFTDETGNKIDYLKPLGNLTIQEGVKKIGARAFAGNLITSMYFPKSIEDATNALQDANINNLIQTKLTEEQLKTVDGFADYYPFGSRGYGWNEVFEVIQ